jgi:hypothetical protein
LKTIKKKSKTEIKPKAVALRSHFERSAQLGGNPESKPFVAIWRYALLRRLQASASTSWLRFIFLMHVMAIRRPPRNRSRSTPAPVVFGMYGSSVGTTEFSGRFSHERTAPGRSVASLPPRRNLSDLIVASFLNWTISLFALCSSTGDQLSSKLASFGTAPFLCADAVLEL